MTSSYIYKILTTEELNKYNNEKTFIGTDFDKSDGFIHCSFKNQVENTYNLFFKSNFKTNELYILTINSNNLNNDLKIELGFPHIYSELSKDNVLLIQTLEDFLK
jgi:uncharacterized protein (DUF952 family)